MDLRSERGVFRPHCHLARRVLVGGNNAIVLPASLAGLLAAVAGETSIFGARGSYS